MELAAYWLLPFTIQSIDICDHHDFTWKWRFQFYVIMVGTCTIASTCYNRILRPLNHRYALSPESERERESRRRRPTKQHLDHFPTSPSSRIAAVDVVCSCCREIGLPGARERNTTKSLPKRFPRTGDNPIAWDTIRLYRAPGEQTTRRPIRNCTHGMLAAVPAIFARLPEANHWILGDTA